MLYPRATKKEKQERKEKLQNKLKELETRSEIKDYLHYLSLPRQQQKTLLEDWDKYFDNVKTTKAYKRFWAMRPLFKTGENNNLIKAFAAKAREQIENNDWELPKPYGRDPQEYSRNDVYLKYKYLKTELEKLMTEDEKKLKEAFT